MRDVAFLYVFVLLTTTRMQRQKCNVVENAVELSSGEKRKTDEERTGIYDPL
jgi:hypothetical protein